MNNFWQYFRIIGLCGNCILVAIYTFIFMIDFLCYVVVQDVEVFSHVTKSAVIAYIANLLAVVFNIKTALKHEYR